MKEVTNGSIKEEESHCLKKLTRVLSQRIGEERICKKYKRNAGLMGKRSGQVFEMQVDTDVVNEEFEGEH